MIQELDPIQGKPFLGFKTFAMCIVITIKRKGRHSRYLVVKYKVNIEDKCSRHIILE